ncbi:tyrosine-type recombinase/integrase [Pseudonocardia sp. WMMC193]|uniref:tyrosine-type recombinase/integrase n=1 Tax=Pseudonocardia sp. WMMC193 TaxID=2911965 RepID=UPI001F0084C7|nr:tyrosine-type recombinase/integrase [Pseudonocardia sp. WMMC193]MCF7552159.1 tyrosine-type recombinase/integrase [Pseudonocardia sp. WMMC193]
MASGSIETLRSGFRARVYAGKDPITHKQTYLRGEVRRSRADAEADKERLLALADTGEKVELKRTVGTLLDRWMETVEHELSTAETSAGYIRRTIKPALGDMPIRKLQHRVDILDKLYAHLRRCNELCTGPAPGHTCKPMSAGAVRRVHAILSASLNYGVSWGWIERNPADYAHPPKLARRQALPPRPEQVAELLNAAGAADEELGVFLWLAVTTGARRGELVALRWSDFELERGLLRVGSSYVVRSGVRRLKGTKTGEERLLSLDSVSVELLTQFRVTREAGLAPVGLTLAADAFLFSPDPAGANPWHPDHFTHAYRDVANGLGITEPLKNLRHFNATQLLAAGVDLRTTAGRLGHSDGGATTLRVYASWTKPADQRAAELLAGDLTTLRAKAAAAEPVARLRAGRRLASTSRPPADYLRPGATTYLEVASAFRMAVRANELAPGDLLPTVPDIAAYFGLARSTAQRAVTSLGQKGIIERSGNRWVVAKGVRPEAS